MIPEGVVQRDARDGYAYLVGDEVVLLTSPLPNGSYRACLIGLNGVSVSVHIPVGCYTGFVSVYLPQALAARKVLVS